VRRCALVLLKMGRTQDAVLHLTHVLDLYRWRGADFRSDKLIIRTMAECRYLTAAKQRSVNWPSVQFKDNCYVVDPLGAGDYMSLSVCLSSVEKPVWYCYRLHSTGCFIKKQPLVFLAIIHIIMGQFAAHVC